MFFIAAAAMTFASCQIEMTDLSKETISVNLNLNADVEQTKTYLGDGNVVLWGENEAVTLYVGSDTESKFFDSNSTSAFDGEPSASFLFEIDGVKEADSYTLGGIYPASAAIDDNKNAAQYKVALPATQNQVDGNYDPSAYIMVLKPEVVTELPAEYTASFRRAVALNKITLTNVAEEITSVEITVPEGKYLAGRRYVDLTTAEFGEIYENGGRTNTIKVNSDFAITDNSIDVWFTSWGVEIASGEQLTIKMVSETSTYTRIITARAEGISFVEGDMNLLTVNMENAEKELLEDFSGQYLIAAMPGAWNLMSGTIHSNNYFVRVESQVKADANTVDCSKFYELENIDDYVWTVGQMEGGYSIKNNSTNKYVSYSGTKNEAYTSDVPVAFALSLKDGIMTVESVAVSGRKLQYNSSSPRFAFYTGTQQPLYFIPWIPDETPRISVSKTEISVDAEATEVTFEYTTKNIPGDVSVEVADGATMTIVEASASEGVVTVTFDANNDAEAKTATIVLSYVGAESKEVVINQDAAGAVKQYYVKVTSAPADWSGTYLIVANTSAANGTITSKWLKFNSVAINDNTIATSDETNCIAATIVKDSDGYYTIMFANGNYLGTTNNNDGIKVTTANITDDFKWQFSVSSGLVKIATKANSSRYLRLNGTSGFRTYTNTTGTQATLYRLESVN